LQDRAGAARDDDENEENADVSWDEVRIARFENSNLGLVLVVVVAVVVESDSLDSTQEVQQEEEQEDGGGGLTFESEAAAST
jgi:hypothetical protein